MGDSVGGNGSIPNSPGSNNPSKAENSSLAVEGARAKTNEVYANGTVGGTIAEVIGVNLNGEAADHIVGGPTGKSNSRETTKLDAKNPKEAIVNDIDGPVGGPAGLL